MPDSSRVLDVLALLALVVLTALLALWGAALTYLRLGGYAAPLGLLVALLNAPLCLAAGRIARSTTGAALPAVVWIVVVAPMLVQRREGDLFVDGSPAALGFLLLGAGSALVAVAFGGPRPTPAGPGGRSTGRAADPPRP